MSLEYPVLEVASDIDDRADPNTVDHAPQRAALTLAREGEERFAKTIGDHVAEWDSDGDAFGREREQRGAALSALILGQEPSGNLVVILFEPSPVYHERCANGVHFATTW